MRNYVIDCQSNGIGILQVENIIKQIENNNKQCWLSVSCTDNSYYYSSFSVREWEEFKNIKNSLKVGILSVVVNAE